MAIPYTHVIGRITVRSSLSVAKREQKYNITQGVVITNARPPTRGIVPTAALK